MDTKSDKRKKKKRRVLRSDRLEVMDSISFARDGAIGGGAGWGSE